MRRRSHTIMVGDVPVGGGHPVVIQSMTNTDPRDPAKTLAQIGELVAAGCEIVRVAVPDKQAVEALRTLRQQTDVPLVADIHFDHRLALAAMQAGADGLRINPGNIGGKKALASVVQEARRQKVPIRIGVNSGSLEEHLRAEYGGPTPEALVQSALEHVLFLESLSFLDMKVSVKSTDVSRMVEANRMLAEKIPYPLHIGVTEAGPGEDALVKSAVGLGALLVLGIGDTLRVSLTGDPVREIRAAKSILQAAGVRRFGPDLISCPTCGRTGIDVVGLSRQVEEILVDVTRPLRVAVMGCVVNGPGEAREADLGIAGGPASGVIFARGEILRRVPADQLLDAFREDLEKLLNQLDEEDQ